MPDLADDYADTLSPLRAERVRAVRDAVLAAFPDTDQSLEWGGVVFRRGERYLAISSKASYFSIYTCGNVEATRRMLASDPKLRGGKACVNVRDTTTLPIAALTAELPGLL